MAAFPNTGHYEMLVRGERSLNDALPLIAKAESCGVDCTEFREGLDFMRDRLAQFRSTYFPDQVTPPSGTGISTGGG